MGELDDVYYGRTMQGYARLELHRERVLLENFRRPLGRLTQRSVEESSIRP